MYGPDYTAINYITEDGNNNIVVNKTRYGITFNELYEKETNKFISYYKGEEEIV